MASKNTQYDYKILQNLPEIMLSAGALKRILQITNSNLITTQLTLNGNKIANGSSNDVSLTFSLADPDERPKGILPGQGASIEQKNSEVNGTDALEINDKSEQEQIQQVKWKNHLDICSNDWNNIFSEISIHQEDNINSLNSSNSSNSFNSTNPNNSSNDVKLTLTAKCTQHSFLAGVEISIIYQIFSNHPVIRKWVSITNNGTHWIKIENLMLDSLHFCSNCKKQTLLTPSERGACSSIIAFSDKKKSFGVILGNEIPSALRKITKNGQMGYNSDHFEWVLGPSENFLSEPCFYYGFEGNVIKTTSSISTPLDRIVEGKFIPFLESVIGIRAVPEKVPVPLWCTWSNFIANINDPIIREQADLASRCGFSGFQIDAGWSDSKNDSDWTCGSRIPHSTKFPDFQSTCDYVRSKGLTLGLWLSCYRNISSPDLKDLPNALSLPKITRGEGIAMSFSSAWREYFANDIIGLSRKYGAKYFKQDLTNMKFGDIAEGHENRTKKESLLRSIRGYLTSQDIIHEQEPDVCTLLSHEIYWGTPGVPCDLAALKHCWTYHIPPNDYSGVGNRGVRVTKVKPRFTQPFRKGLLAGCFHARKRYYAHRGLPLYGIEYYGAATVNADGSLTPEIQDRQICSWLMGTPTVYSGDLSSLTEENIAHYNARFSMIKELQTKYQIYRYFQFSGVPSPTDWGWHWWGKINSQGYGVVVVIRGKGFKSQMNINIPWVKENVTYRVRTLLKGNQPTDLGEFTGKQLQDASICLELPRLGQEILELMPN